MFGLIGTAIYGIAYAVGWSIDEQREQKSRKLASQFKNPTYRDKWGNERYTSTGKKKKISDYQEELHNDIEKMRSELAEETQIKETQIKNFVNKKQKEYVQHNIKQLWDLSLEEYIIASEPIPQKWKPEYNYYMSLLNKIGDERVHEILVIAFCKAKWRNK